MKQLFLILLSILSVVSCKDANKQKSKTTTDTTKTTGINDSFLEKAVIYEINIRQYSPEGTFAAFQKDIPKLKEMGVDILWTMPIHPIGKEKRKGGLGSYYSIQDYRAINPEFGTLADFRALVDKAHAEGMYVIMDWVANHTAWDHDWMQNHPDYYAKDSTGQVIAPYDWTDVAKLDYNNPKLREAMIADMQYWVSEVGVDGFRCDVAGEVPTDFWETASDSLHKIKPVFMLAEAEKAELLHKAFDMQYGWELHHIMNKVAQGTMDVSHIDAYMQKADSVLQKDDISMLFTSNHDENSWNGTVKERMGDAAEVMAALSYTLPGMPLIYNGQEYDLDKRLAFFEKDSLPKTKGFFYDYYTKLNALKKKSDALDGGKEAATYHRIPTEKDTQVLAFKREKNGQSIVFIANLSNAPVSDKIVLTEGYETALSNLNKEFVANQITELPAWGYYILNK